jgi:hypothetical protein
MWMTLYVTFLYVKDLIHQETRECGQWSRLKVLCSFKGAVSTAHVQKLRILKDKQMGKFILELL